MALSTMHLFCSIILSILYLSAAQLAPTSITSTGFSVQWNEADFISKSDQFKVTVDGPDGQLCEVESDCNAEGDAQRCKFSNSDATKCDSDITNQLLPCTDLNVTVSKGETLQFVEFNLAPDIKDGTIDPELSVDGNKATLTWFLQSNGEDIACATRAKVTLQVGSDSELMNEPALNVTLGATNIEEWTLDNCQQGVLIAKVVYLTKTGDFPTVKEFLDDDKRNFQGIGVTNVIADAPEDSCSLEVSWDAGCSEVNYNVTCGEEDITVVTDTSYNCTGLTAGSHTVAVQAYLTTGEAIGMPDSISKDVALTAPDAPVVKSLVCNDESVDKLTVTWDESMTSTCAGAVTGYTINTSPGGTPVDVFAEVTQHELTGLTGCTEYMVSVAAKWSTGTGESGTGESGTKTEKTGSQAPYKPTDVTSNSTKSTEIELSWTAPVNINACPITNYTVTWTPGNDDGTTENESTTTTYTITGLTPITNYTITVTTNTVDGKDAESDQYLYTTSEDQAVTGLSGGEIAGIVCGSIAGVAIIAGVIFIYIKKMFCFATTESSKIPIKTTENEAN